MLPAEAGRPGLVQEAEQGPDLVSSGRPPVKARKVIPASDMEHGFRDPPGQPGVGQPFLYGVPVRAHVRWLGSNSRCPWRGASFTVMQINARAGGTQVKRLIPSAEKSGGRAEHEL